MTPTLYSPIVLEVQPKHHLVTLRVGYDEKRITLANLYRHTLTMGWDKHRHSSFAFELDLRQSVVCMMLFVGLRR